MIFTGSAVALVTPFTADGEVDFAQLSRLIDFHLENDTQAIVVNGTTGEGSTLSFDEKKAILSHTIQRVGGKIPVIAGTGSNDTRKAIQETEVAAELGADGAMLVTPYYNKTSQAGLIAHYHAVADAVDIPIVLYNVPSRTGVSISVDTVVELAQHPNIVAIKEASGNMSYAAELFAKLPEDFAIYSGNDDLIPAMAAYGSHGVISVLANIYPKETQALQVSASSGEVLQTRKMMQELLPIMSALFSDVNPIGIKAALNYVGLTAGPVRLPLVSMSCEAEQVMQAAIDQYQALKVGV